MHQRKREWCCYLQGITGATGHQDFLLLETGRKKKVSTQQLKRTPLCPKTRHPFPTVDLYRRIFYSRPAPIDLSATWFLRWIEASASAFVFLKTPAEKSLLLLLLKLSFWTRTRWRKSTSMLTLYFPLIYLDMIGFGRGLKGRWWSRGWIAEGVWEAEKKEKQSPLPLFLLFTMFLSDWFTIVAHMSRITFIYQVGGRNKIAIRERSLCTVLFHLYFLWVLVQSRSVFRSGIFSCFVSANVKSASR